MAQQYCSDVLIRCGACGFTASEHEFATYSEDKPLTCPKCGETAALEDVEE